jgi:hypothetical protein
MNDPFVAGAKAALEGFRAELLKDRGRIENEEEPVFDVIVDLLDRTIAALDSFAPGG